MNLILLAGNSVSNKAWIESVDKVLAPLFDKTAILYYKHWEAGSETIDFTVELNELVKITNEIGRYVIFAKSAGALLAIKGMSEKKIKPEKCIFAGTAIGWSRINNFGADEWLEGYSVPTLFIQKTRDPAFSFRELGGLLEDKRVKNYSLKEVDGDDHSYSDMEMLKSEVRKFVFGE